LTYIISLYSKLNANGQHLIFTIVLSVSDGPNMLRNVLQNVLDDPSFHTKSQEAANAIISAEYMLHWCSSQDNLTTLLKFSEDLIQDLEGALINPNGKVLQRDKIWESYFYMRSQETFTNRWTIFLYSANSPTGTPVLYQHLTDIIFKELLRKKYSVSANESERVGPLITINECNVLRYVAGYVCRHLRKKIEASNHPLKEDMVLCLMTMVKDKSNTSSGPCEEWTDLVDRGGLWHVQENTHSLFLCLEEEICLLLPSLLHEADKKEKIINELSTNEDVLFYWLIVGADFEEDDERVHAELLKKIIELFVTIRGFSYASGWLEKYKQRNKKGTQKSKSLCKRIN